MMAVTTRFLIITTSVIHHNVTIFLSYHAATKWRKWEGLGVPNRAKPWQGSDPIRQNTFDNQTRMSLTRSTTRNFEQYRRSRDIEDTPPFRIYKYAPFISCADPPQSSQTSDIAKSSPSRFTIRVDLNLSQSENYVSK